MVAIATLYGVVLARRFGAPEVVETERRSLPASAGVAIVLGAAVGSLRRSAWRCHGSSWLMYSLATFAYVLIFADPGQVGFEAEQRAFRSWRASASSWSVWPPAMLWALVVEAPHPQPELATVTST